MKRQPRHSTNLCSEFFQFTEWIILLCSRVADPSGFYPDQKKSDPDPAFEEKTGFSQLRPSRKPDPDLTDEKQPNRT